VNDIVVTGAGAVLDEPCDPTPFLRTRKLRKFMGTQDALAVVAAARALQAASLEAPLGERCGLYLTVGYIPFEREDIDQLLAVSVDDELQFSMQRFAANAFSAINPLLTFRVLPNMPAFHVSLNFDIQGPYAVSYPSVGQFYLALEEAFAALDSGAIDIALVGAIADQNNLLVRHHFSRIDPPVDGERLANAAAFLVLERAHDARDRGASIRARVLEWQLRYASNDAFEHATPHRERFSSGEAVRDAGPASLAVTLAQTRNTRLTHTLQARDGFEATSVWEVA
jgi:3-oxoacyl-[acyl-carrier-protein] synthase II